MVIDRRQFIHGEPRSLSGSRSPVEKRLAALSFSSLRKLVDQLAVFLGNTPLTLRLVKLSLRLLNLLAHLDDFLHLLNCAIMRSLLAGVGVGASVGQSLIRRGRNHP